MKCMNRLQQYKEESFDRIILMIRNGTIKTGRYSHLVKINENKIIKGKELFKNESNDN